MGIACLRGGGVIACPDSLGPFFVHVQMGNFNLRGKGVRTLARMVYALFSSIWQCQNYDNYYFLNCKIKGSIWHLFSHGEYFQPQRALFKHCQKTDGVKRVRKIFPTVHVRQRGGGGRWSQKLIGQCPFERTTFQKGALSCSPQYVLFGRFHLVSFVW